ncbi:MAG: hypothetical protein ACRDP4_15925, partial [Nocardioidaceae bacterium]
MQELRDRIVASDPGLNRLRMATSAVVAMGSALAVEAALAAVIGVETNTRLVMILLGAVVAMMGSMGLTGSSAWRKVGTAVFFPVAIGVGMATAITVSGRADLVLIVFVAVMFLAVAVRRFGLPFFFYGFMAWLGYFFATFVHATWAMLPQLLLAVVVSSLWVLLLAVTVLRTNRRRTLRRSLRAYDARARGVASASADLLDEPPDQPGPARLLRRVHGRQIQLAESALMIEGWVADPSTLPDGWSGAALRRRLLDAQLAVDAMVAAAEALVDNRAGQARQAAAH